MTVANDLARSPTASYGSIESFYAADERRRDSREQDFGLWWRADSDETLHRAAWVCDTGELYLMRLGPVEDGGGQVEVLGRVADHERLESVLEGWRDQCGRPSSLSWLRDRVSRLGVSASRRIMARKPQRARARRSVFPPVGL